MITVGGLIKLGRRWGNPLLPRSGLVGTGQVWDRTTDSRVRKAPQTAAGEAQLCSKERGLGRTR